MRIWAYVPLLFLPIRSVLLWENERGKLLLKPPDCHPADGLPGKQHIEGMHICMIDVDGETDSGTDQPEDPGIVLYHSIIKG